MRHRPLGSTGLTVSPIGLGTVKLGRDRALKSPSAFTIPDDEHVARLLHTAADLGINLIDTAPAYGNAEQRLGNLLPPPRDRWTIVTKAGESFDPAADSGRGASAYDFSPEAVTRSVERSLANLRTDHLDAVLLHSDGNDLEIIERSGALHALADLRDAGKTRAIGVSTKTPEGARRAADTCDVVMLTINPHHTDDTDAAAHAGERGVGVLVKKALASGHLAGRGPTAIEDAFRFAFAPPWGAAVSSVIVGTINPDHLAANAHACERAANP